MTGAATAAIGDAEVVERLAAALGHRSVGRSGLTVRGSASRRRSDLWFVGHRGERQARYVVKRPHPDSRQDDLTPPLASEGQLAALERLGAHLARTEPGLHVPPPLALLPEIDAFAMGYVDGLHLAGLARPSAVLAPGQLLDGMATAARVLRALHAIEPERSAAVRWDQVYDRSRHRAGDLLARAGLPAGLAGWDRFPRPGPAAAAHREVLLHGDFAPENVLLSRSGVFCLDPELTTRGRPETDVVRFLTMLVDAPLFVAGGSSPAVRRLRQRAAARFLTAYYAGSAVPDALPWLMAESVAARWATRHQDCVRRQPSLAAARLRLLRRHFSALLDEVGRGQPPEITDRVAPAAARRPAAGP